MKKGWKDWELTSRVDQRDLYPSVSGSTQGITSVPCSTQGITSVPGSTQGITSVPGGTQEMGSEFGGFSGWWSQSHTTKIIRSQKTLNFLFIRIRSEKKKFKVQLQILAYILETKD